MSLPQALECLKNQAFSDARDLMAREKVDSYGIAHFLVKGLAELALQEWAAAAQTFAAATARFPAHAPFWLNRGMAEENLGQTDTAIASYTQCLSIDPSQAESCGNLSNLYRQKKGFAEAEDMARRALANGAIKDDALNCLGLALGKQGKFEEARQAFREAHKITPGNAIFLANHANLEIDDLNFSAAWPLFAAARALDDHPVIRHDEGQARLLAGDYERGLPLFESRLDMPRALRVNPLCPRWRGESLQNKRLLILAEQGFGDVIQFCRYGEYLTEGELIWAVPSPLTRLLSGVLRGVVVDEATPLPVCDYYVPMMSLALITGEKIPPPPAVVAPSVPLLPAGKHLHRIGIVWTGSPTHERDHERSLQLKIFSSLFKSIAADFYAPCPADIPGDAGHVPLVNLAPLIGDFADTAALLRQMDILITVDTAGAHLAGTLGVPTFLLLPRCPDWRWGAAGEKTAWYPSMTILRQTKYGDWEGVIAELIDLLKRRLREPA